MFSRMRLPSLLSWLVVSNEFKKLMPHPDGDLHTILNAWNTATWLQQLTKDMENEPATKVWGKSTPI